jgi:outer membrane protein OmpA-like peptidoglycan-associated protein
MNMKMKILNTLVALVLVSTGALGQTNLGVRIKENAKNRTTNRIENRAGDAVERGLDKVEDGIRGVFNKKDKEKEKEESAIENREAKNAESNGGNQNSAVPSPGSNTPALSVYSKFDFIPGEKIVASEDFSQDAIGDFPAKWNTNGTGELVLLNNSSTKYLKTSSTCVFYPEWVSNLPDNFTVEFDLLCSDKYSYYSGFFVVGFSSEKNIGKHFNKFMRYDKGNIDNGGGFEIGLHPVSAGGNRGMTSVFSSFNGEKILENDAEQDEFAINKNNKNIHVSIWRQKGRVRVYINEKKIWDIPRLCPETTINSIYFRNDGADVDNNEAYYISNLRIAVGAPDTRSKLITEGKFSTTGIKFDSGSDKIKPESYGTLQEIANVLKENPGVRIKIVGHTDSDGNATSNLELSKRRSASVKQFLVNEFGIQGDRMETDGKGQSEPVAPNTTPEGKANNRRVEFIKL